MIKARTFAVVLVALTLVACEGEPASTAPQPTTKRAARAHADLPLHPGTGDATVCVCEYRDEANVWCEMHRVGYVAGIPVRSALVFKTLDAHGHEIDPASLTCATCRSAAHDGGYCDSCRIGWHHSLAYMTRFTWFLAQGEVVTDSTPLCDACRARAKSPESSQPTWCDRCNGGLVGTVFFRDRTQYLGAAQGASILARAMETVPRCEMCACAMVYDRTCPECRIRYVDGVATPDDAPKPVSRDPS